MFGVPKICQRRREAVGWRTPDKVGVQFFPGNISTATWLGDLPSSCHTMWWTHSWVGRLQAIAKKIYMQVINCPKRMVPVLSSGEGTQTNMRTGIGSPAFGGSHQWPFTSLGGKNVLITKRCQDGGDTTGALQEGDVVIGRRCTRFPHAETQSER